MRLEIAVLSKAGGREPNEDAFGCWSDSGASFCLLSDGAGGHGGGDVASKLAVRAALARFQTSPECSGANVTCALRLAHEAIMTSQRSGDALANMRATAVVLAVDTAHASALWGHLGDTRLYCFRGQELLTRTKDHSVVQRMVDAGYLRDEDLRRAPDRSQLFAALGQDENFFPTVADSPLALIDGDAFLLCTDGFWEYIDEAAMAEALTGAASPEHWLARMEQQVIAHGGKDQDNYSAMAVWCGEAQHVPFDLGTCCTPTTLRVRSGITMVCPGMARSVPLNSAMRQALPASPR